MRDDYVLRQLRARIAELEDGACRFNCRKEREAFSVGYQWGAADSEDYDHDSAKMANIRYAEWLKDRNGHEGTS